MLGIFRKSKLRTAFYQRDKRAEIDGEVYIKRPGREILRSSTGNISPNGLYVELFNHDLEKGKKVEIIVVKPIGSVKKITRMRGIVIRTDDNGAAMVTYRQKDLTSISELELNEMGLKQDLSGIG